MQKWRISSIWGVSNFFSTSASDVLFDVSDKILYPVYEKKGKNNMEREWFRDVRSGMINLFLKIRWRGKFSIAGVMYKIYTESKKLGSRNLKRERLFKIIGR